MTRPAPGFLSPMLCMAIALVVTTLAAGVSWKLYRAKAAELESFKVAVKVAGDAQEARTKAENARLLKGKEDADKSLTTARADLKRLRGANSGGRHLPGPGPIAGSPDSPACYSRAELDRAYGSLVTDLRAIADEGATCQIELGNAREWARTLPAPR